MLRSDKYRLYPSEQQEVRLKRTLSRKLPKKREEENLSFVGFYASDLLTAIMITANSATPITVAMDSICTKPESLLE